MTPFIEVIKYNRQTEQRIGTARLASISLAHAIARQWADGATPVDDKLAFNCGAKSIRLLTYPNAFIAVIHWR